MAWSNPFHRVDENTRRYWGYTFQLSPLHLSAEESTPLKFSYDRLGEECLDVLNAISPPHILHPSSGVEPPSGSRENGSAQPATEKAPVFKAKRDLYVLLRDNASKHERLRELWDEVNTVPEWVDWDQISRGQEVFYRYGGASLTGLAYQSLLGGMGANRVVEVLARTGGFSVKVARHRLFETTQHILQCTKSLDSIQPGGGGFASSIRVRLLHAAVRQRIMKLERTRPGYYDVEKCGVPINDLDCIATIASFSCSIIWISLPRQGIWLRQQEIRDYLALWRLIAHYTGTPTDYFATPEKARAVMETLLMTEINPSETSKILAGNIIKSLQAQPPAYASKSFLEVNARWLNGNELGDALGLGRPSPYYWALMAGQCLFFMGVCYIYRSIPWLDRRKVAALRRIFWTVVVEAKYGLGGQESVFEFKYIPDFHLNTAKTTNINTNTNTNTNINTTNNEAHKSDAAQVVGVSAPGIERRNLLSLLAAVVCTGTLAYGGVWIVRGVLYRVVAFFAVLSW